MTHPIPHPSQLLSPETVETIRQSTTEAELKGELTQTQLNLIDKGKWFRLFIPEQYGGLQLSLPEAVQLEESLAWADGSVGWVVTLCAGAAMFTGYFDPELARELFAHQHLCFAGSGQTGGTAQRTASGFDVNGYWPYASGTPHATHFTANCFIQKDGNNILKEDGTPLVQSFVFKRNEVTLHANWKYFGLHATGGHAYSVKNLSIPANRTFVIDAAHAQLPDPVYRYPFLQLAETTLSANISGMCLYFLDLSETFLFNKNSTQERAVKVREKGLQLLAEAREQIHLHRSAFYQALNESWKEHTQQNILPEITLHAVSHTSRILAQKTREWVDNIYPYCGLEAAHQDSRINQVWRNIHTASQHSLLIG